MILNEGVVYYINKVCFSVENIMAALLISDAKYRPLNRWDHDRIQPGNVHSVGDTITGIKLKHSQPDLPIRYEKKFSGKNAGLMGDNNTDGGHTGYFNHGYGSPYTKDSNWPSWRQFDTPLGWIHEDLRPPDKSYQPLLSSTPNAKWDQRVAETYKIYRPGFDFLPLPHGYQPSPGDLPRGGNTPTVTDVVVPECDVVNYTNQMSLVTDGIEQSVNRLAGSFLPRPGRRYFPQANTKYGKKR